MHRTAYLLVAGLLLASCSRQADTARMEGCLACHGDMLGFMPGHDPKVIGCASCHLGDPDAAEEKAAHAGMVLIPGNLDVAEATCSTTGCHPGINLRVNGSLMNTMRGVVGVDRFAFGENPTPDGDTAIRDIGHSPADTHLRNLCASCHLGAEKTGIGPVTELSRGGGCLACHLNYDRESLRSYAKGGMPTVHPQLSLQVSDPHCFGCHSRSGRISTSYEGWHETLLSPAQATGDERLRVLADGRVFTFVTDDIHHAAGLECIDCHDGMEIMGDGQAHAHKEDAVSIACTDCHLVSAPQTRSWDHLAPDEQRLVRLRGQRDVGVDFLIMRGSTRTLTNARTDEEGVPFLVGKNDDRRHALRPPAADCSRGTVHAALSCSACHTAWAPQCISCHTSFRPDEAGYDLLARSEIPWRWEEAAGHFLFGPPTLGVRLNPDGTRQIMPFVPGMILDLDLSNTTSTETTNLHYRLFAPSEAHTTSRDGRGCASCHLDPVALGYGRGSLVLAEDGWSFAATYAPHPVDALPLDAWIGFLKDPLAPHSTRINTRPFTREEQEAVLRAGACLTCHDGTSEVMQATLSGLDPVTQRMSPDCRAH